MTHLLARLDWPGSPRQLACFRITLGLYLCSVFTSPVIPLLKQLGAPTFPWTASVLPGSLEGWLAQHAVSPLVHVGVLSSLLLALGLFTSIAAPVTLLAYVVTQNYYYRQTTAHDDWLYFTFCLVVLCFARSADDWSIDARLHRQAPESDLRAYRWPRELMIGWFALLYVAAGLAKLLPLRKGAIWIQGRTLQDVVSWLVPDSMSYWLTGGTLFDYRILWPWAVLSCATLALELGAASILFSERALRVVYLALLGLHLGIYIFGIAGFFWIALTFAPLVIPAKAFNAR